MTEMERNGQWGVSIYTAREESQEKWFSQMTRDLQLPNALALGDMMEWRTSIQGIVDGLVHFL
jgi:hypothetical protein